MQAPLLLDLPEHRSPERRRQERTAAGPVPNQAIASLGMAGKVPAQAELTDVSAYGCCIETEATWLRPGRFVAITLPAGPPLESIVRWTRGSLAGLELLRPAAANRPDWLALID